MSMRKRNKAHYTNMGRANFQSRQELDRLLARVLEKAEAQA